MNNLEKLEELIYRGFKETDRKMRESSELTDRKMRESSERADRKILDLSREVGNITDTMGRFAENMVAPAIVKLFNERGIPITDYAQRVHSQTRKIEYDIVAFNKDCVVVVSVKLTLRVNDVKEFLYERLPIFKDVFPRYKEMKVLGAVAGASIVQASEIYAMKRGLYVLAQSGDNIALLNDDTFEAKVF